MMHLSDPKSVVVVAGAVILLGLVLLVWQASREDEGGSFGEAVQNNFVTQVFMKYGDVWEQAAASFGRGRALNASTSPAGISNP